MTENETTYETKALTTNESALSLCNSTHFDFIQRVAKMLTTSTLVPEQFRAVDKRGKANPSGLANCVVALNMAQRMNADELMVMQNLYVIEGRPSWSSQFIISAINSSGRFEPLRFKLSDKIPGLEVEYTSTKWEGPQGGKRKVVTDEKVVIENQTCIAWTRDIKTGDVIEGPEVSIEMAVKEGWRQKNGSKWLTMPEVMLRYRAASFFGRLYCPEILMGIRSEDETRDIINLEADTSGAFGIKENVNDKVAAAVAEAEDKEETPGKPNSSDDSAGKCNGPSTDSLNQEKNQQPSKGSPEELPPWHPDNHKGKRWQGLVAYAKENSSTWDQASSEHQDLFLAKWSKTVGAKAECLVFKGEVKTEETAEHPKSQGQRQQERKDEELSRPTPAAKEQLTGQEETGRKIDWYDYHITAANSKEELNKFVDEHGGEIDSREDASKIWDLYNSRLEILSIAD